VRYRADDLGYVRVRVPINRVDSIANLSGIIRINVDAPSQLDVELDGRRSVASIPVTHVASVTRVASRAYPWPTPNGSTPQANAFTGVREIGAAEFKRAHPSSDGRGVRIAFLEREDPTSPFLQKARTLQGKVIPKLVDMINALTPDELGEVPTASDREYFGWTNMFSQIRVVHGRVEYRGRTFHAPHDGVYQIGMFQLRDDVKFENVLHPHGTPYADSQHFPILWDKASGSVWVDANQSGDFSEEPAMHDYRIHRDVGYLRLRLNDWSMWDEHYVLGDTHPTRFVFVVQTDPARNYIALHMPFHSIHGTGVASTAVGQGYFGGAFDGVAPSAEMVSTVMGAAPYSGGLEGLIAAARYPKVDVISLSWGACFFNEDGLSVMDLIVDRLVYRYQVLPFISAANDGPGLSTLCSPSTSDGAVSVGAYISKTMFAGNDGAAVPRADNLAYYSSRGPRRDGGLKPDLVAPTEVLGAQPMVAPRVLLQRILLPRGYGISNGTSTAAPMAAGAAALLISAAKQAGIAHDPLRVKRALIAGARQLGAYGAAEQGGGLVNVPAAWQALMRMKADPVRIIASAPVKDISSDGLVTPNSGEGLFEREGWQAGAKASRSYTFLRADGPLAPQTYQVRWVHNDGTFSGSPSISLPLGTPAQYRVYVAPQFSGVHSALFQLVDPTTRTVVDERLNTIVAAEQLGPNNQFTITHRASVEHPGIRRYFFSVPSGANNFTTRVSVRRQDLPWVGNPWVATQFLQLHMPNGRVAPGFWEFRPYHDGSMWSESFADPVPGVWEVDINNTSPDGFTSPWETSSDPKTLRPIPPTMYSVTASAFSLRLTRRDGKINSEAKPIFTLINRMAPVSLRPTRSVLGALRTESITLTPSSVRKLVMIDVPKRTTEVEVTVDHGSQLVDIFLFSCTERRKASKSTVAEMYPRECVMKSSSSPKAINVARYRGSDITAGRWIAVIDAAHLTAPVTLHYHDVVASASYGTVYLQAVAPRLGRGKTTDVLAEIHRNRPVPLGASLVAVLQLEAGQASYIWEKNSATTIVDVVKAKPAARTLWPSIWQAVVKI